MPSAKKHFLDFFSHLNFFFDFFFDFFLILIFDFFWGYPPPRTKLSRAYGQTSGRCTAKYWNAFNLIVIGLCI